MNARLNSNARTTAKDRKAIRESPESLQVLAKQYGINPKTVAKWKKRASSDDLRPGPKAARSGKLKAEEEGIIVRFREHTLLPLDDCLYALQAQIPHLTRSSLHRCLQRHGISRLAETTGAADERAPPPLGWLHIDTSVVYSGDGSHHLFNAIDQSSKFVFVQMRPSGGAADAAAFLDSLIASVPFPIHRVITLNTAPFVEVDGESALARICRAAGIEHRFTSSQDPWARARSVRLDRIIEESVTFASTAYIKGLLEKFVHAYNFRRRLKTLRGRTPYEFICEAAARQPELFLRDPHHEMVGLEILPA